MSYRNLDQPLTFRERLGRRRWGLIWAAIGLALVVGVIWLFIFGFWMDADARAWQWIYQRAWLDTFFPNGWNIFQASWFAYVLFGGAVAVFGWLFVKNRSSRAGTWTIIAGIIIALVNLTIFPMWLNNMQPNAGMSDDTTVVVESFENSPPALKELFMKAEQVDDSTMKADVRGYATTIKKQVINLQWATRPASAKGAEIVMRSSGDSDTNSYLMGETLSYHSNGKWSAIRDGQNLKPIAGVSVWDGVSNSVQTCRFDGANEIDYAFNGQWGKNLMDLVVSRYPNNLINSSDMWGDCDSDGAPFIVMPTTVLKGYGQVRVPRFGGLIVIKGSQDGQPSIQLVTDIKTGQFTGPVYPSSLAAEQRAKFDYAAGIISNMVTGFGTETSTVPSQVGNPSEYLLKSAVDGHLYWVTPLRPNQGESQQVIGYSVLRADEARTDSLNEHRLYFFSPDDERLVDMSRLYSATVDAVNTKQPAFFTGDPPGVLTELLPASNGLWQAFAERGGRVVYRIDISTKAGVVAKVVNIGQTDPPPGETKLVCNDPGSLSKPDLRKCIDRFLDELEKRQ